MIPHDFDTYSFHDNRIRGLSYVDEDFKCTLTLDIDYICEWHCDTTTCEFTIAPAYLMFTGVTTFSASIQRMGPQIESYLGTILDIVRTQQAGIISKYEFELVDDGDRLIVEASNVELRIWGAPLRSTEQHLYASQRIAAQSQDC
jgi:hypothetical protein